jgi:hypothetical protein
MPYTQSFVRDVFSQLSVFSLLTEVDFLLGFLRQVSGNLETKYKVKELGLTFTEKWNTDNTLNTTVDIQDKLLPGLKVSLSSRILFYIFCSVFTDWPGQFFLLFRRVSYNRCCRY